MYQYVTYEQTYVHKYSHTYNEAYIRTNILSIRASSLVEQRLKITEEKGTPIYAKDVANEICFKLLENLRDIFGIDRSAFSSVISYRCSTKLEALTP